MQQTDPSMYRLFVSAVRAAIELHPQHFEIDVTLVLERPDGSTRDYRTLLDPDRLGEVPWDIFDAIHSIGWHPLGKIQRPNGKPGDGRSVYFSCDSFAMGLFVRNWLDHSNYPLGNIHPPCKTETIGVTGRLKRLGDTVPVADEQAVIIGVLEHVNRAYQTVADEGAQRQSDEDYVYEHGEPEPYYEEY